MSNKLEFQVSNFVWLYSVDFPCDILINVVDTFIYEDGATKIY